MSNPVPIHCPGCRAPLGLTVIENKRGAIRLYDGKMTIEAGETHCPACGRMFHWRSRDYTAWPEVVRQFGQVVAVGV